MLERRNRAFHAVRCTLKQYTALMHQHEFREERGVERGLSRQAQNTAGGGRMLGGVYTRVKILSKPPPLISLLVFASIAAYPGPASHSAKDAAAGRVRFMRYFDE